MTTQTCNCSRCSARCQVAPKRNSNAKMLRKSATPGGLCVNCAFHDWLRNTYPVNMLLDEIGPKILLYPHIREMIAGIMQSQNADATIDEINFNLIVENWELPRAHKVRGSAMNPYNPERDGPANRARRQEALKRMNESDEEHRRREARDNLPMTLHSFDQLNVLEDGLGDALKNAMLVMRAGSDEIEVVPIPPPTPKYETYTPGCFLVACFAVAKDVPPAMVSTSGKGQKTGRDNNGVNAMNQQQTFIDVGEPKPKAKRQTKASVLVAETAAVVKHYQTYHPRYRGSEKERALIRARLTDGYSVKDLQDAIDGCHRSPFHNGDNDRKQKYQTVDLIFRSGGKVQEFLEIGRPKSTFQPAIMSKVVSVEERLQAGDGRKIIREALGVIGKMPKDE